MFCQRCRSLLVPKNKNILCSCGYYQSETLTIKLEHTQENKIDIKKKNTEVNLRYRKNASNAETVKHTSARSKQARAMNLKQLKQSYMVARVYSCTKFGHTLRSSNSRY